jgi:hypothetical protein
MSTAYCESSIASDWTNKGGASPPTNPVPRGLPTRRQRQRPRQGVPLVKVTRILHRILAPGEVDALTASLRTDRDEAMVP